MSRFQPESVAESVVGAVIAGRKRVRKAPAARRAEIAAAAREIALEDGLADVTLRAVAARAGVAPALVAHYHPNMDALVAETFGDVVAAEIDEVVGLLAACPAPSDRLRLIVRTLLDGARGDVTIVWVEAWALGRRNDALATTVRIQMDAWQAVVQGVVEAGVADDAFTADDPASVAWQLLGMIDGLNAQALVRWGEPGDRGALILRALEGMLRMSPGALAEASGR